MLVLLVAITMGLGQILAGVDLSQVLTDQEKHRVVAISEILSDVILSGDSYQNGMTAISDERFIQNCEAYVQGNVAFAGWSNIANIMPVIEGHNGVLYGTWSQRPRYSNTHLACGSLAEVFYHKTDWTFVVQGKRLLGSKLKRLREEDVGTQLLSSRLPGVLQGIFGSSRATPGFFSGAPSEEGGGGGSSKREETYEDAHDRNPERSLSVDRGGFPSIRAYPLGAKLAISVGLLGIAWLIQVACFVRFLDRRIKLTRVMGYLAVSLAVFGASAVPWW